MELTFSTAVGYLLGIMVVFVIAKICLKPLKFIIKIVLNSVIGGAALLVLNTVGKIWGIHIGINGNNAAHTANIFLNSLTPPRIAPIIGYIDI